MWNLVGLSTSANSSTPSSIAASWSAFPWPALCYLSATQPQYRSLKGPSLTWLPRIQHQTARASPWTWIWRFRPGGRWRLRRCPPCRRRGPGPSMSVHHVARVTEIKRSAVNASLQMRQGPNTLLVGVVQLERRRSTSGLNHGARKRVLPFFVR